MLRQSLGRLARGVNAYVERRLAPTKDSVQRVHAEVAATREQVTRLRERLDALEGSLEVVRAVTCMTARRVSRTPVRALFLVHHIEAWYSVADVVAAMGEAADFETIVASIPRRFPGATDFKDEPLVHAELESLGVPHVRLDARDSFASLRTITALDPDLVFRQSQWDADVQPAFSTTALGFARLCLVPYEPMNIIENAPVGAGVRDSATDSEFHRACWAVFCANPMVQQTAATRSPATGGRQFIVTGHPKANRLRAALSAATKRTDDRFTVLWSAHHSIDDNWSRFGTFPGVARAMVDWAASRPDWRFVFSPHPALVTMLESATPPLTRAVVEEFTSGWAALPNTEVFGGADYGPMFASSDVLVTDGLSWLLEYQIAGKPVVFLDRPDHRPFNALGRRVVEGVHPVADVAAATALVDRFAAGGPDPLAERQRAVVEELFGDHDAPAEILDAIRSGLAEELARAGRGTATGSAADPVHPGLPNDVRA